MPFFNTQLVKRFNSKIDEEDWFLRKATDSSEAAKKTAYILDLEMNAFDSGSMICILVKDKKGEIKKYKVFKEFRVELQEES